MNKPKNLTTKEVAAILNCSESLVRRQDMKEKLGAFYIAERALRFPKDQVDEYINVQKKQSSDNSSEEPAAVKKTLHRKKLHSNFDLF
ncbi:AlpA family transcriptional regulator [Halodesulfovibrio sp. MK-HDV]|uniref:helix-turn-helix transcriptional regulator n=1 Tax=Halodesulfovibrio sp. MK-HDV TaxID=2599925 RepID=UPI0013701370|nr:helix-turn-helix domain-containing protein [Halodesulfovibrio sp. MK-HDV]KAF1077348.1 hypothetical protein MKHDV_00412 [Halodesulfovibrio sp. MK-HDV]